MPEIRYAILEEDKAKASTLDGGTETIDLPEEGILSELTLQIRSLGAFSTAMSLPFWIALKKIEVLVNGSKVVKSLTGQELRALEWYNGGPYNLNDDFQGAQNHAFRTHSFPLYFGKFAGDLKNGLRMESYTNPRLKFTWDTTQTSYDGNTVQAHTDPTLTYSAIAKMIDGPPAGFTNKYVKSSEIDVWANANSATHPVNIPRGEDLLNLMWRGGYQGIKPEELLDHIKLDFNNGKYVPLDMNYAQLWQLFKSWFPKPCINTWYAGIKHGITFDTRLLKITGFTGTSVGIEAPLITFTTSRNNMKTISVASTSNTAYTTALSAWLRTEGFGPHQTIMIPMKQLTDGSVDVIPTAGLSKIALKLTTGSAAGTSGNQHCVAEYLVPNGR